MKELDKKFLLLGIALVIFGVCAKGVTIGGSCSSISNQCDLSLKELELCNDSAETHSYLINVEGEKAAWFNVIPDQVTLQPEECRQLRVYIIAECYAEPGEYQVDVVVRDDSIESITCFFELRQGHRVDIGITPVQQTATQCEEKSYDIVLTNNSTIANQKTERVQLRIDGLPGEWYELEESEVLVSKGSPEKIGMSVRAPCDAEFGQYEFEVEALLVNPDFMDSDSASYILTQGQEISVDVERGYDACIEEETSYSVSVTNLGKLDDRIQLELDSPDWVKLDRYELGLEKGETKNIELIFEENSAEVEKYPVSIGVKSLLYEYETTENFDVYLSDCYNLVVKKVEGDAVVCVEESPKYIFEIKNNAVKDVDVDITIAGIGAELSDSSLLIKPNETKKIEAIFDVQGLAREASVSQREVAIEIVMDSSGSMIEKVNGNRKIEAAKNAIVYFVNNITEVDLGLRVFGQEEGCASSELLVPISRLSIAEITDKVEIFSPNGMTPLADTLEESIGDFPEGKEKAIILVSDGKETCGGDLKEVAEKLSGKGIAVYAIGFDIDENGKAQLTLIADTTNGMYFDAKDSEELSGVFKQITKELDITAAKTGEKSFSLNLSSDKFNYSEGYELSIEDCYNIAVIPPALNLCKGVQGDEFIGVSNLGTKSQLIELEIEPSWIQGRKTIKLEGNSSELIPIKINTPLDATEEEITVRATSEKATYRESKPINYLSSGSCFGVDLILLETEMDAWACEGKTKTLIVENKGVTKQRVSFSADVMWVYFDQKEVQLEKGERKEVYFLISPPLDLPEGATYVTISILTDYGFASEATIKLNVFGTEPGLEPVDLRVNDINVTKVIEEMAVDVEVEFYLRNDSNRTMNVFSIEPLDFNAVFDIAEPVIKKQEKGKVTMYLDLPEGYDSETVIVPIKVKTDEGTFIRNIEISLPREEEEAEVVEEEIPVGAGFAGLLTFENTKNAVILLLLSIVIGLIIYSILKATEAPEEPKAKEVSLGEITERPKKPKTKKAKKKAKKRK